MSLGKLFATATKTALQTGKKAGKSAGKAGGKGKSSSRATQARSNWKEASAGIKTVDPSTGGRIKTGNVKNPNAYGLMKEKRDYAQQYKMKHGKSIEMRKAATSLGGSYAAGKASDSVSAQAQAEAEKEVAKYQSEANKHAADKSKEALIEQAKQYADALKNQYEKKDITYTYKQIVDGGATATTDPATGELQSEYAV